MDMAEIMWVNDYTLACVVLEIRVVQSLKVALNAPNQAKMDKIHL